MIKWWCKAMLVLTAVLIAVPPPLRAQDEIDGEMAVEYGQEALQQRGSMPWYDAEKDDLRPLDVPPEDDGAFTNRKSKWEAGPATPQKTNTPTAWNTSLGEVLWNIMQVIFWLLLIAVVGALVYFFVRAYLARENASAANASLDFEDDAVDESERIASLPFTVARPRGDLLDEARAMYQDGNYRQAVIYLFSYLLIQCDRHQQIHLARGKTNRQYLRELRQRPELRSILEQTMVAFEDVFFGDHVLSREEFEACWHKLDDFHHRLEQTSA